VTDITRDPLTTVVISTVAIKLLNRSATQKRGCLLKSELSASDVDSSVATETKIVVTDGTPLSGVIYLQSSFVAQRTPI